MSEYKCNICEQVFKTKQNLAKHQNKMFKCNFKTPYQCNKCLKYFRKSASLFKHTDNKICDRLDIIPINNTIKNNTNIDDAKVAIRSIMNSSDLDEKKLELLTKLHVSLTMNIFYQYLNQI